jgi:hypothetical protein
MKPEGRALKKNLLSPGAETAAGRLSLLIFLLLIIYFIVYVLTGDIAKLLSYIPDDSAYFLEIAENAAAGHGLSFDGLHATNGYQPLWQFVLVPFYAVVKTTPEIALRLVLLLQVALLSIASYWFYGTLGRIFPPSVTLVSVLFFVFYVFVQAVSGMETALLVFVMALLFRLALAGSVFRASDPKRQFVFGMVLGLVMLARLDMVFLAAAVEAFCLGQFFLVPGRRKESLVRMLAIFLGATLLVAPYLVFNLVSFGSMAPISAQLKHGFPHLAANIGPGKIPPVTWRLACWRRDSCCGRFSGSRSGSGSRPPATPSPWPWPCWPWVHACICST